MKRNIYIFIVLSLALALPSCKIGKKYARPELDLPEEIVAGADTASIDSISWQSLYVDTTLQRLITIALDNNKDMKIAAAKVKEMIASKRITFADQFPEIGARIYGQKERLNYGGDNPKPDPEYGTKLALSWELDLWGNLRWANEAGIAAYLQSVEARHALQMTLVAEVAAAYYELCALDQEQDIVRHTLAARREGVRLAKLRFEGGLTSETSYSQAQVELARTETLLPSLEQKIKIKENDLAFLLGQYSGDIPRGLPLREQHLLETLPVGLPSSLLERRPDMRQAEQKLREANARVGVAQTDLFPKISLTGNLGFENEELTNFIKSPAWFLAGDLLQPLFAMGKNKAKLKAARARYEQEVYNYQKSVLGVFKEVNNAIVTIRKAQDAAFAALGENGALGDAEDILCLLGDICDACADADLQPGIRLRDADNRFKLRVVGRNDGARHILLRGGGNRFQHARVYRVTRGVALDRHAHALAHAVERRFLQIDVFQLGVSGGALLVFGNRLGKVAFLHAAHRNDRDFQHYNSLVGSPSRAATMCISGQAAHAASSARDGVLFSAERCASSTCFVPAAYRRGRNVSQAALDRCPRSEAMRDLSHAG